MRWNYKPPVYPKHADTRTREWFAWLPVTIGRETRWLERVKVLEVYDSMPFLDTTFGGWFFSNFIDTES
jgi:hypothetical protein